ncbi:hypothetical protein A2W13_00615 [Candidatus Woesebacteria bacterium RBG_16_36_11]|uniref:Type II secretion system protein GspG C-terminal domain-containing protein n=3 Tax=Candidatus Woeseibacteriota TaxID=1752722 RepID=A0A1F7X7H0_9BACT|nr:MAG: hypothetical protein A2Z67_01175 [Candidatus Woesebacteria bacterium RBG_13_36_22]OGM10931.1 MAG: hypothetical protein A2W13_00615 [Candidatus Woesebacteria bacterium RBG_16_36_11]OGM16901.1 MAG: hypothetical protein A2V55_03010 [Candidatus Woesebacteria bacterium RBG_19FT_COMBO_37_29]
MLLKIKNPILKILNKGFTLIELLVVISIIAILATLLIANINSARARARDAQRKADLRNIQTALRLYYNDYAVYPASSNGQIVGCGPGGDLATVCAWNEPFATNEQTYMSILPGDPSPDGSYVYARTANDEYTLQTCLENRSDDKCGIACENGGCQYLVQQ